MKKDLMIATAIVLVSASLVSALLHEALTMTDNASAEEKLLADLWNESMGAPIGSLVEHTLSAFLCFGIGVAILAFADYGVIAMLAFGGIGIGYTVCTIAGFFSHSTLLGIAATLVGGAYLIATMTIGIWRFRRRLAEDN